MTSPTGFAQSFSKLHLNTDDLPAVTESTSEIIAIFNRSLNDPSEIFSQPLIDPNALQNAVWYYTSYQKILKVSDEEDYEIGSKQALEFSWLTHEANQRFKMNTQELLTTAYLINYLATHLIGSKK